MMATATSFYRPMLASEYHADKSAWSRSMLLDFRDRQSICYARHVLGEAPVEKSTKAMDVGDLAHAALLEPNRLYTDYVVYPKELLAKNGAVSTNAAKEFRDSHESDGFVVLKQEDFDAVGEMVKSVHAKFGHWLKEKAIIENAVYWTDELSGLTCRCRPDFLVLKENAAIVLDLKTTSDVSPWQFRKRTEDNGNWLQDVHYSAGVREVFGLEPVFVFIVVESQWPYDCAAYRLSEADKVKSESVRRDILTDIGCCLESGNWSDEWSGVLNTLELRKWIYER